MQKSTCIALQPHSSARGGEKGKVLYTCNMPHATKPDTMPPSSRCRGCRLMPHAGRCPLITSLICHALCRLCRLCREGGANIGRGRCSNKSMRIIEKLVPLVLSHGTIFQAADQQIVFIRRLRITSIAQACTHRVRLQTPTTPSSPSHSSSTRSPPPLPGHLASSSLALCACHASLPTSSTILRFSSSPSSPSHSL